MGGGGGGGRGWGWGERLFEAGRLSTGTYEGIGQQLIGFCG